jgi:ABC-type transport system substrate-binding protein
VEHGRLIAEQLGRAGFQVTVETLSRAQYLNEVWQQKDFQVSLGPLPPAATTNAFLLPLLHSRGQWHITDHQDVVLDRLIEQQSSEMDPVRRGELVRQVQARVLDQALLFMPVITVERWAFSPRVVDFYPNMEGGDGSFWQGVGLAPASSGR